MYVCMYVRISPAPSLTPRSADHVSRGAVQYVQSGLALTWAVRLGWFLFTRVLRAGHDKRFEASKNNPILFMIVWFLQVWYGI